MRRRLAIPLLLLLALAGAATVARAELSQKGNLRIAFDAGFSPTSLPRTSQAPVAVRLEGRITTTDGTHPPALTRLEISLNRHGRINPSGLPACTSSALQSTSSKVALARCRPALVGEGSFEAELSSSGSPVPVDGRLLAFNGRSGRHAAILLHLYVSLPVQATLVLPLTIEPDPKGRFGNVLAANIPVLAGGVGSVTQLSLRIDRTYASKGRRVGYLSASCAAPAGFSGGPFTFARGRFRFADGRTLDTSLTRNCQVRG
jgi:hypothetical protein